MTGKQKAKLMDNLRTRSELQHTMAEHTRPVLELELGIDTVTLWHIETGAIESRPGTGIDAATVHEVMRRRTIWQLAKERMQEYTLEALADRHGISVNGVCRYARKARRERWQIADFEAAA